MGIGPDIYPLICTDDVALAYRFFMPVMTHLLIAYFSRIAKRYLCEILSKASLKSRESTQRGVAVTSACAMASWKVFTASRIRNQDRSAIKSRYTHCSILSPPHPSAPYKIIFTLRSQTTKFCWVQQGPE